MVLRGIGRVFVTVGLLVLMFLGYQLYGTNAVTNQVQGHLAKALQDKFSVGTASAAPGAGGAMPSPGEGVAIIQIPKIAVDKVVVEGTEVEDLKKGPGHYRDTAFPGQLGNVVISGHRTTYGAPFYRLDELSKGDEILLKDASGTTYKYSVIEKKIVEPTDLSVVVPSTDARLTLTTCNPRFSARQRLIIVAALQGTPRQ